MKIILTVGLPRSGKSSWARQQGLPIVCPDTIRLALHGQRFLAPLEWIVWPFAYIMAKALFLSGADTIIIDATNVSTKRREEWSRKFPEAAIELKIFDTTPDECMKRAVADNMPDLVPVIGRMAEEWDISLSWKKFTGLKVKCRCGRAEQTEEGWRAQGLFEDLPDGFGIHHHLDVKCEVVAPDNSNVS
jgi:predicted kinase